MEIFGLFDEKSEGIIRFFEKNFKHFGHKHIGGPFKRKKFYFLNFEGPPSLDMLLTPLQRKLELSFATYA